MAYHPYHFVYEVLLHPVYIKGETDWLAYQRRAETAEARNVKFGM